MENKRLLKFSRLIQKDLGDIFQREGKSLFGNTLISVTRVRMSNDLSVAKIFLSFLKVGDQQVSLEDINFRKNEIRGILGRHIGKKVRIIPELIFYHDDSSNYASRIDEILSGLDIPASEDDKD
ncbi:MAG: 30S ribosome-binding factor RbfA [Bacteroidetes bacterium]|nr:30S ribosome-binding factor RbfA [Bacteroidota bacterium]